MDELGPTIEKENIEFKVARAAVMRPCIERCGDGNMMHIWMRCGERKQKAEYAARSRCFTWFGQGRHPKFKAWNKRVAGGTALCSGEQDGRMRVRRRPFAGVITSRMGTQ